MENTKTKREHEHSGEVYTDKETLIAANATKGCAPRDVHATAEKSDNVNANDPLKVISVKLVLNDP